MQPALVTQRRELPVRVAVDERPLRAVRVFSSADSGASWQPVGHQRPDEAGNVGPVVFRPDGEGYYLLATQAIYQDGTLDPTPQAGEVTGMLVLIDRQPPVFVKWDVLQKYQEALLLWRFTDAAAGRVEVHWSADGSPSWQVIAGGPNAAGPNAAGDAASLPLIGSVRVALPGSGRLRLRAVDASGLETFTEPRAVQVKQPAPPPPPDDGIPTAPVWSGWLEDAEPVIDRQKERAQQQAQQQAQRQTGGQSPAAQTAGLSSTAAPQAAKPSPPVTSITHRALRLTARESGPVGAAARVDLVLALLADGEIAEAQRAVDAALPAQRSTALACAAAQVALADGQPDAAEKILARIPASSRLAAEANYWRAEAAYQADERSRAQGLLRALAEGRTPWAARARIHPALQ
jgi:hypothetical protein